MGAIIPTIIYFIAFFSMHMYYKKTWKEMEDLYNSSTEMKESLIKVQRNQIENLKLLNNTNLDLNKKLLNELKESKGDPND